MRLQLGRGAPGHLASVIGRDSLILLVHLGRPPVTHPLEQTREAREVEPVRFRTMFVLGENTAAYVAVGGSKYAPPPIDW